MSVSGIGNEIELSLSKTSDLVIFADGHHVVEGGGHRVCKNRGHELRLGRPHEHRVDWAVGSEMGYVHGQNHGHVRCMYLGHRGRRGSCLYDHRGGGGTRILLVSCELLRQLYRLRSVNHTESACCPRY